MEKISKIFKNNKYKFHVLSFSIKAFKTLTKLKVKNIKIPSGELTNYPLLEYINYNGKNLKIFLSTGMSSWRNEIDKAMKLTVIE